MNSTVTDDRTVPALSHAMRKVSIAPAGRKVIFKTHGHTHGSITRLVSPNDLGELIKPFVFLDYAVGKYTGRPLFGIHPHSGIATLTAPLSGGINYEDTTGKSGVVMAGGLEWMKAGNGVWHDGGIVDGETVRLFQLWISLPPGEENAPAESQYIASSEVRQDGSVRVLLGSHGKATSPIRAPEGINYFHINLKPGQIWRYVPSKGHTVGWLAVDRGRLNAGTTVSSGELAIFEEGIAPIEVEAEVQTSFVFGSAIKHPYELVTGYSSVHTNREALTRGEAEILRIGRELRAKGRI